VCKGRFSEEQIIAVLKESEAGVETRELCRRHGIKRACFYRVEMPIRQDAECTYRTSPSVISSAKRFGNILKG